MTGAAVRRLGLTVGSLVAALAALIGWVAVRHRRPLSWDLALHNAAPAQRAPAVTAVAVAVTSTAEGLAYVVAAVGGLLALRPRPWWLGAPAGAAAAVCWAVAVGITRVYLGVHWPTDVLGGWLFGTLLTMLAAVAVLRLVTPAAAPGRSGQLGAQRSQQQHEGGQL